MRCFGCGAEGHLVHSCPEKCGDQSAQLAMAAANGGVTTEAKQYFSAAVASRAPASATVWVTFAVAAEPVAPVLTVAFAGVTLPTVGSLSVTEALAAVENSSVGEFPETSIHPSVDEPVVSQSGSEGQQPTLKNQNLKKKGKGKGSSLREH